MANQNSSVTLLLLTTLYRKHSNFMQEVIYFFSKERKHLQKKVDSMKKKVIDFGSFLRSALANSSSAIYFLFLPKKNHRVESRMEKIAFNKTRTNCPWERKRKYKKKNTTHKKLI